MMQLQDIIIGIKVVILVKYAEQMIEHNDRTNGEFYLAPVYNWAIKDGKKFRISHVTKVLS